MNSSSYVAYRTIFKEENAIGSHCWIKMKQLNKGAILIKEEENFITESLRRLRKCYSKPICGEKFSAQSSMERRLYSIKLLFWMVAKYSKYIDDSPSDALILNRKAIQKSLDSLSAVKQPFLSKPFFLTIKTLLLALPAVLFSLLIACIWRLHPSLFKVNTGASKVGNDPDRRIVARWHSPAGHLFTNSVESIEETFYSSEQEVSALAIFLIAMSGFILIEMIIILLYSLLHYRHVHDPKDKLAIYKTIMERLAEDEQPLDDATKQLLQKRGVAVAEIADYRIYSNAILGSGELADLFERIRKEPKQRFHKIVALELDSSKDLPC